MIVNFADDTTQDIYDGKDTKAARKLPKSIWPAARRKVDMLDVANDLRDLTSPPRNKLEKLRGDLAGFYSIRVNDQFRIIFRFSSGQASDVQIVDYH